MQGSVQDKLTRVRPPRVKITYDVETGGAQESLELPFIAGIFADLTGSATSSDLPPVAERKMVGVDPDTFEEVMKATRPSVDLTKIHNLLSLEDSQGNTHLTVEDYLRAESQAKNAATAADADPEPLDVNEVLGNLGGLGTEEQPLLVFEKMEHFEPEHLIKRINPLADVYGMRVALRELQSKSELLKTVHEALEQYIPVKNEEEAETSLREGLTEALLGKPKEGSTDAVPGFLGKYQQLETALQQQKKDHKASSGKDMSDQEIQAWVDEQVKEGGSIGPLFDVEMTLVEADASATPPVEEQKGPTPLARIFSEDGLLRGDVENPDFRSYEIVASFAEVVKFADAAFARLGPKDSMPGVAACFDNVVAEIDARLSRQLDEVLHNPEFQELEATWKGMSYLLNNTETSTGLKLRVMNVSKKALLKELSTAVEFDQSSIFKRIYEYEYGTYGGHPYSMLMGGYEFSRSPDDQQLLQLMSSIAAAAHAPFIASAFAELFDMESFESLAKPRDLSKIFESVELASWQSFRESEDSRYVSLALPRVLFRLPWGGEKGMSVDIIDYEENVMNAAYEPASETKIADGHPYQEFALKKQKSVNGNSMLWGNAAWVLAQRITNAQANFGWTAAIRGVEGGGLVDFLPSYTYTAADGDIDQVCPTQVSITDRREKELNDLGFMAICHCKGTAKAAFFGGQSTNLPKKYLSDTATANAHLSSQLPYMLCASRFAHYIKVMMREKIGSFMTKDNVSRYLNNWISQYVLLDDEAPQAVKAKYPLRAASVVVTDNPSKPGSYNATVFLRPHFQLEELTTSIRLVAEIPG